jgi:hypothetical protein
MTSKSSTAAASLTREANDNLLEEMNKILKEWSRKVPDTQSAVETHLHKYHAAQMKRTKR